MVRFREGTVCAALVLGWVLVAADADGQSQRTSWGVPDLQGVWTISTRTPFERPESLPRSCSTKTASPPASTRAGASLFFRALPTEDVRHGVVALVTGVLVERLLWWQCEGGNLARNTLGPLRGIVDSELVAECAGIEPGEPLGDGDRVIHAAIGSPQEEDIATGRPGQGPGTGVCLGAPDVPGFDDECVTLPVPTPAADPLADIRRHVRTTVQRDDSRVVDHLEVERHVVRRLEDHEVVVVERWQHRRTG